jgi:hypothetical protein
MPRILIRGARGREMPRSLMGWTATSSPSDIYGEKGSGRSVFVPITRKYGGTEMGTF